MSIKDYFFYHKKKFVTVILFVVILVGGFFLYKVYAKELNYSKEVEKRSEKEEIKSKKEEKEEKNDKNIDENIAQVAEYKKILAQIYPNLSVKAAIFYVLRDEIRSIDI